jgi:hypothetical protein
MTAKQPLTACCTDIGQRGKSSLTLCTEILYKKPVSAVTASTGPITMKSAVGKLNTQNGEDLQLVAGASF